MPVEDEAPFPDPLSVLAFLAGQTSTIGLAAGVLILPLHHPVVLAKRLATVDALSGGRLRVAVGVGWMREETEACGVDFRTRGRRANEQIEVLRTLWGGGPVDHEGEFFQFEKAVCRPTPVRPIPVHIGGNSPAAARRAGRLGDGLQPLLATEEQARRLDRIMRTEAERAGRDPDALELSLDRMAATVTAEDVANSLADRIVLLHTPGLSLPKLKQELSACAHRLGL